MAKYNYQGKPGRAMKYKKLQKYFGKISAPINSATTDLIGDTHMNPQQEKELWDKSEKIKHLNNTKIDTSKIKAVGSFKTTNGKKFYAGVTDDNNYIVAANDAKNSYVLDQGNFHDLLEYNGGANKIKTYDKGANNSVFYNTQNIKKKPTDQTASAIQNQSVQGLNGQPQEEYTNDIGNPATPIETTAAEQEYAQGAAQNNLNDETPASKANIGVGINRQKEKQAAQNKFTGGSQDTIPAEGSVMAPGGKQPGINMPPPDPSNNPNSPMGGSNGAVKDATIGDNQESKPAEGGEKKKGLFQRLKEKREAKKQAKEEAKNKSRPEDINKVIRSHDNDMNDSMNSLNNTVNGTEDKGPDGKNSTPKDDKQPTGGNNGSTGDKGPDGGNPPPPPPVDVEPPVAEGAGGGNGGKNFNAGNQNNNTKTQNNTNIGGQQTNIQGNSVSGNKVEGVGNTQNIVGGDLNNITNNYYNGPSPAQQKASDKNAFLKKQGIDIAKEVVKGAFTMFYQ